MNTPRLFVGGVWHGRVVSVPADLYSYRVPILGAYTETECYELRTFASRESWTGVRVFVLVGARDEGNGYVLDAAARALGLDVIEGPAL